MARRNAVSPSFHRWACISECPREVQVSDEVGSRLTQACLPEYFKALADASRLLISPHTPSSPQASPKSSISRREIWVELDCVRSKCGIALSFCCVSWLRKKSGT